MKKIVLVMMAAVCAVSAAYSEYLEYNPEGEGIVAVTAISHFVSGSVGDLFPEYTVDRSGLNADDTHVNYWSRPITFWSCAAGDDQDAWIQYEFDKAYELDELWVWNFNQGGNTDCGMKDVVISYSTDGINFTVLSTNEFAQADGTSTYEHNTEVDLGGISAKYIKLTAVDGSANWGDPNLTGLSEVRFYLVPEPPSGVALSYDAGGNDGIVDVTAISHFVSSSVDDLFPVYTVDQSGLNTNTDTHVNYWSKPISFWSCAAGDEQDAWIQFEFDHTYKMEEMWVWNFNQGNNTDVGMKDTVVSYSTDGINFTVLSTNRFAQADGTSTYEHNTVVDFGGINARYIKLAVVAGSGNWGDSNLTGLSEVRFYVFPELIPAEILSLSSVSDDLIQMAINVPGSTDAYSLFSSTNLVDGSWFGLPHSNDGQNPFVVTNLSYSGSMGGSTNVIYVQADDAVRFFKVQGAD